MAWTLQSLIDGRMTVTAYCSSCNHSRALNLPALRDKLGPDTPAMSFDLAPRLRCDRCKGKAVTLTYSPGENAARANAYQRARVVSPSIASMIS